MEYEKAGFWTRVAAHVIDWVILSIVFFIFQSLTYARIGFSIDIEPAALLAKVLATMFLSFFFLLIFFVYFTYFHGAIGQTIGKMLLGIKVVSTDQGPINYTTSFVRCLAYQASWSSLGLGFLWAAFHSRGQSWHDKIADTLVIKVRSLPRGQ